VISGFIGGFVGLQRRLKDLTPEDLQLISHSMVYTCLSPLVGGVLALLLYILFLSGLLSGDLWCFVAGYSERFVTDVIGRFEGAAIKDAPQGEMRPSPLPHKSEVPERG
jgi:hypothetical protein